MSDQANAALRSIDERIIRLERDLSRVIGRGPGPIGGISASDYGCCSDKGCCQNRGCCQDKKDLDVDWRELIEFAERFDLNIGELIERVEQLNPNLLGTSR